MELRPVSRINARTLPVRAHRDRRGEGSYVQLLECCTAPMRDKNSAPRTAVVELVALDNAQISTRRCKTGTPHPGDAQARGASTTSRHQRGAARGKGSQISWTHVEPGRRSPGSTPASSCRASIGGEFPPGGVTNNPAGRSRHEDEQHRKHPAATILSKALAGHGRTLSGPGEESRRAATGSRNYTLQLTQATRS